MKIIPQTSDVQQQVRVTNQVKSSLTSRPDFSSYLKTGTQDSHLAVQAPADMDVPEIDEMAREMWGTAYDPVTHTVRLEALERNARAATEAFARKLGGLLRDNGIDTSGRIDLTIGQDGRIYVPDNDPAKFAIEQYFDKNPELGAEFRKISSDNDMVAMGKLASEYSRRWEAATSDVRRQAVFSYFSSMFDHAKRLGGQMRLSMDMLTSPALEYASRVAHGQS